MLKNVRVALLLGASILFAMSAATATDIAKVPFIGQGTEKPNVIFGMDDSGSMDFEVLLNTNDGSFWWDGDNKSGWDSKGKPFFNSTGTSSGLNKLTYLFPNGCEEYSRRLCESNDHYAIPPTPQFASLRSAAFNPQYYNPSVTYTAWKPATIGGSVVAFTNATPTGAYSHPLFSSGAMNLTAIQLSRDSGFTFEMFGGMDIPAGADVYNANKKKWETSSARTVKAGGQERASIGYYPATYWQVESCTPNGSSCVNAPTGVTLKRYEIKSGTTFPSGRSYADELQNFANWFTYYRKRKLMLAGSMGQVMEDLRGMRVGAVSFNNRSAVTMYDTDAKDDTANGRVMAGFFYGNTSSGGTPTRETLKYIGDQFNTNKGVIQYSCQKNAAFIVTDGFSGVTKITPPTYTADTYGKGSPYQTTYAGTLADIALSYYTNRLRTDLAAGNVPAAAENSGPSTDKNKNLHMNTYGITLGANGTLWPGITDAYAQTMTWPNPSASQSPTSIDDLWHATVNGRGDMFLATTPKETATAVKEALTRILQQSQGQSGAVYSTVNLKADNSTAFLGSFRVGLGSGDLEAFAVNPSTGIIATRATWSANKLLLEKDWTTRKVVTFNGTNGAVLNASTLGGVATMVNYIRGDRTLEGSTYRIREGMMGAVITSEPVVSKEDGVVFVTANDGMLHAFDQATGAELWAYAPRFNLADMRAQTSPTWEGTTIFDGTPVIAKVGDKRVLVGGRGIAGSGYYAIDITGVNASQSETEIANRVLWEFPAINASADLKNSVGVSAGKPVLVKTSKYGWVALLTSGYNSTRDGKGRLFAVDALTGAVSLQLATTTGSVGAQDSGLAQVSGFLEADGSVRFAYAGDEKGNVWRFDLDESKVLKLASLVSDKGAALPITTAPELAVINGRRMVLVGTGRLLGTADRNDLTVQSFFGLWDNNTAISDVRKQLAKRTITVTGTRRTATGTAVNWQTQRGWYVDLPAGEKVNSNPVIAYSVIAFTSNKPSAESCSSSSALYLADVGSGLQLGAEKFDNGDSIYGEGFATTLTSDPTIARTITEKIAVTTRQSDNTTTTRLLKLGGTAPPRRLGWKEVLR